MNLFPFLENSRACKDYGSKYECIVDVYREGRGNLVIRDLEGCKFGILKKVMSDSHGTEAMVISSGRTKHGKFMCCLGLALHYKCYNFFVPENFNIIFSEHILEGIYLKKIQEKGN